MQRQACLLDFVPHPVADASAPFGTLHNFLLLQWHCCMVPRRGCLRLRINFYFPCFFRSGTNQLLLLFLPPFFLATNGWICFLQCPSGLLYALLLYFSGCSSNLRCNTTATVSSFSLLSPSKTLLSTARIGARQTLVLTSQAGVWANQMAKDGGDS